MAEYVLKEMAERAGLKGALVIDSAATSCDEIGCPVYPPARRELGRHGISCSGHRARRMERGDYERYDLLIGMEEINLRNMRRIAGGDPQGKMRLLLSFTDSGGEIDDPWYTGRFAEVYDQIERGCRGLLDALFPGR